MIDSFSLTCLPGNLICRQQLRIRFSLYSFNSINNADYGDSTNSDAITTRRPPVYEERRNDGQTTEEDQYPTQNNENLIFNNIGPNGEITSSPSGNSDSKNSNNYKNDDWFKNPAFPQERIMVSSGIANQNQNNICTKSLFIDIDFSNLSKEEQDSVAIFRFLGWGGDTYTKKVRDWNGNSYDDEYETATANYSHEFQRKDLNPANGFDMETFQWKPRRLT